MQRLLGPIALFLVGLIVLGRFIRPDDTANARLAAAEQPADDIGSVGPHPVPGVAVARRPAGGIGNGGSNSLGGVEVAGRPGGGIGNGGSTSLGGVEVAGRPGGGIGNGGSTSPGGVEVAGRPAGIQRSDGSTATGATTRRDSRLTYVEIADLPAAISPGGGSPAVLVLYGAHCPLSHQLLTGLARVEAQYRKDGVRVLALNVDDDSELRDVPAFLRETGARFPPARLATWPSGALAEALRSIGSSVIQPHRTFTLPVVVIWNREGRVVAESQAMPDAAVVGRVIAAMTGR